jgi:predicted MFS family arabinose efflux permease
MCYTEGRSIAGGFMSNITAVAVPRKRLSRALVFLFALACGISAANLYYSQPVLGSIAKSFHASSGTVGLIVTFAQIGYAIGLAFILPLGDICSRRWLVPSVLMITFVGLVISAFAPSVTVLVSITFIVGLGSVAAQLLVPMAASLSDDHERGRVVGMVMSGLLLGILLARSVSGVIAQLSSWRVVYVVAALMTLILAVILQRLLPHEVDRPHVLGAARERRALLHDRVTSSSPRRLRRTRLWRLQLPFRTSSERYLAI